MVIIIDLDKKALYVCVILVFDDVKNINESTTAVNIVYLLIMATYATAGTCLKKFAFGNQVHLGRHR